MRKVVKRKRLVDRILANAVNVLTAIHASVYFPTFSNGLKEIGRYLGCTWTDENASGLQSLVWRARWDHAREPVLEGQTAQLQRRGLSRLEEGDGVRPGHWRNGPPPRRRRRRQHRQVPVSPGQTRSAQRRAARSSADANFTLEDFDHVNRCAYFDYQRDKVFLRNSKAIQKSFSSTQQDERMRRKLPISKEIEIRSRTCPGCQSKEITRLSNKTHSKLAYDLKFSAGSYSPAG